MKKLRFKLLRYLGFAKLFRFLFQRNKITILLFHDIDIKTAEQTFAYLTKKYNIIDLNTYIEAYITKDYSKIPKYAMIITFDDGHIGNYNILPVIKKYNIPVTIFLCASIIDTNRHFWFSTKITEISESEIKSKSNKERLEFLEKLGFWQKREFDTPDALSKEQIDEMSEYVNMQSHTCFHPILPKCNDSDAYDEIVKSKNILEEDYGFTINAIAYPNGDYSDRDIEIVKKAGYSCAITVDSGFNTLESDLFRLKRVSVNDTKDINELIVKSSGVWAFLKTKNGTKQTYGYTEAIREYE